MSIEVKVPILPESVSEASMLSWHKNVGDKISQGDVLVDLETDKVVLEVPAPADGVLSDIIRNSGDVVTAEEVIAFIAVEGESTSTAPAKASNPEPVADESPADKPSNDNASSSSNDNDNNIDIDVPVLPESVSEAQVQTWHKNIGDEVTEGESIVDLETDKVVLEVPAPTSGILQSINHEAGSIVTANQKLGSIGSAAVAASSTPASQSTQQEQPAAPQEAASEVKSSPSARKLMAENNLSASDVSATANRINKEDVVKAAASAQGQPKAQQTTTSTAVESNGDDQPGQNRVPMTRIRQTIAKRLVDSQHNTAMLTTFNEVDLTEVMALRSRFKESFQETHDVKLGFMSFFVKACVEGLKKFPVVNAYVDGTDIIYHNYCDIGIAVSSPRGLVVPVVRNTEEKSFAQIEQDIVGYGQKARKGSISMDDMTGGTFTITNGGIFGSLVSTPIINPPQSAILGMHAIKERPVAINGEVVIRPMMYLALSYDHRIIDGAEAVQFLVTVKDCLEDPGKMLLAV